MNCVRLIIDATVSQVLRLLENPAVFIASLNILGHDQETNNGLRSELE